MHKRCRNNSLADIRVGTGYEQTAEHAFKRRSESPERRFVQIHIDGDAQPCGSRWNRRRADCANIKTLSLKFRCDPERPFVLSEDDRNDCGVCRLSFKSDRKSVEVFQ